jgi:hypothetical protein
MDVLRPFENSKEVADAIRRLRPNWQADTQLLALLRDLEKQPSLRSNPMPSFQRRLSSSAITALQDQVLTRELPAMPADLVEDLLTKTPFKSVFGKPWYPGSEPGWAPLVGSGFNLFPAGYTGAFLPLTQGSCMNCHEDAAKSVDRVDPPIGAVPVAPGDANRARTWYGYVPGCDGILSGMFIDPRTVNDGSRTGRTEAAVNPKMKDLIRWGGTRR